MKILAVADYESPALWDNYSANPLDDTEIILSCGDLDPHYLEFLVTLSSLPLLYVHGNHDDCYDHTPPEGCICIDDTIFTYKGVRILGLGGCIAYKKGPYLYTEQQMEHRIRRLKRQLHKNRGFDILLTHAPARGLGDGEDFVHRGFEAFLPLLEKYRPSYMIHGHMHLQYDYRLQREQQFGETTIVNAFEKHFIEY